MLLLSLPHPGCLQYEFLILPLKPGLYVTLEPGLHISPVWVKTLLPKCREEIKTLALSGSCKQKCAGFVTTTTPWVLSYNVLFKVQGVIALFWRNSLYCHSSNTAWKIIQYLFWDKQKFLNTRRLLQHKDFKYFTKK